MGQTQNFSYRYVDGQVTVSKDENAQATNYFYSDPLFRLSETDYPDGGKTTRSYNDSLYNSTNNTPSVTTATAITTSTNLTSTAGMDGLGHVVRTLLTSDPEGTDTTDISYNGMGGTYTQSNPHRSGSSSTDGSAHSNYDGLGRTTSTVEADGSMVSTQYDIVLNTPPRNCTLVTDEASKSRKSCSDGLGRLTQVFEDPSAVNYETDYGYDALNNLLTVNQKGNDPNAANWRARTFSYDSLSRLVSAYNPESGTINYAYDPIGNLASKTAPAPNQTGSATVTTSYTYDALNRLTQKSYSDSTATVKYGYDGVALTGCTTVPPALTDTYPKGQRTAMCDGSGATSWSHDRMSRILSKRQTILGNTALSRSFTYTYNLDGSVATVGYPNSGLLATYTMGAAGRMVGLKDGGWTYAQNVTYAPFGGMTSMSQGSQPITTTNSCNSRLQPVTLSASTTATTILSLSYNFHAGSGDNGNVYQIVNNRDNNRTQNFTYDGLNRIVQGNSSGPNWGETFTIDAWGNLTNRGQVSGKTNYEPLSQAALTNNQLTGFGYDAAGNMTSNGGANYTYDAENRIVSTSGVSYSYDGDGNRVKKSSGTLYWLGTTSDMVSESDMAGAIQSMYLSFNGKTVARRDTVGGVKFYFSDHLGSASVITNQFGAMPPLKESDYYPYGGEIPVSGSDPNHYKFTGKERDSESGLDEFGARYYGSSMGRFMTPDWAAKAQPVPYAKLDNPQTLNLYAYVGNNPLSRIDKDGHYACQGDKAQCQAFKDALAIVQKADSSLKEGSKERKQLDSVLKFYGKDDGKGPGIKFGDLGGMGAVGVTQTDHGKTTITFDTQALSGMSKVGQGETVAHEGTRRTG